MQKKLFLYHATRIFRFSLRASPGSCIRRSLPRGVTWRSGCTSVWWNTTERSHVGGWVRCRCGDSHFSTLEKTRNLRSAWRSGSRARSVTWW